MIGRPGILALAVGTALAAAGASRSHGQPADRNHRVMEGPNGRCDVCHTCESPTVGDPCLRVCTRAESMRIAREFEARSGPRVVILDELEDLYLPVPFDHAGHAEMSRMAGGCGACHHYTPEGLRHPACKTCHEIESGKGDIRKPGLKGAYHRQCIGCHREWSGETGCIACHMAKAGAPTQGGKPIIPSPDDLIGRMHPPIPEPEAELYTTKGEDDKTTKVLFRHKEHIHRYELRCADCHHDDNCTRCHEEGRQHTQRPRTFEDHHKPCMECHRNDSCDRCHFQEDQAPPPPFDHAQTGWPLTRYHQSRRCRECHVAVPFTKPEASCNTCHGNWSPATFNHAVTGQRLDENHIRSDCDTCHAERRFEKPPACGDCHDEDEGIAFPARRPGPVVETGPVKSDPSRASAGATAPNPPATGAPPQ